MNPETTIIATGRDLPGGESARRPAEVRRLPRLALICDFLEECWPSMDLFGDMLCQHFRTEHTSAIEVEQLLPAWHDRFSKIPGFGHSGFFRNADRLLNRFHDYPVWLKQRAARFDLFHLVDHSYSQLILDLPAERTVVTCHDLDTFNCLLEPESDPRPRWFRAMAQRTLDGFLRASQVICPSAFTKTNLLRHGLFSPDRIAVIHPGADPVFFDSHSPAEDAVPSGAGPYLLHVGSTIRRKRIDVLLRVFARVVSQYPDLRLMRVGGDLTAEQWQLADKLGVTDQIIKSKQLTKNQLASVYRKAALVLQTSDAEGFGLPVIESLACGCPVVASDIAPLREAGGAAAEYCPVGDIEAWSETVIRLLRERAISPEARELRRVRARQHARGYTWTENANQTMSVYQRVCSDLGGTGRSPA
jgi:glycosyltransferase involved in cell wall biosynthesis